MITFTVHFRVPNIWLEGQYVVETDSVNGKTLDILVGQSVKDDSAKSPA